ncbi:MAG: cobalamin-binding protein, partial [Alphaproteobacteria bacterium]|nr:cobalamin-binding protein [Alphaproteobacteria bacterium]
EVRRLLDETRLRPTIFVGGAPFRFDTQLWREVGADAMGFSATDAVGLITTAMGERHG